MSDNQQILDQTDASNTNDNGGNDTRENYIITLLEENERLQEENAFLRKYLISVKNNSSLKTASILTSVLTFADEHLCRKFEDIFSNGESRIFETVDDFSNRGKPDTYKRTTTPVRPINYVDSDKRSGYSSQPPKSPSLSGETAISQQSYGPRNYANSGKRPGYSLQPPKSPAPSGQTVISQQRYGPPDVFVTPAQNTFRPISPANPDQAYQHLQSTKLVSQNLSQGQQRLKIPSPLNLGQVTPQNRASEGVSFQTPVIRVDPDNSSSVSTVYEKTGQSYVTPRTHQKVLSPNPQSDVENWDSLIYRPPEVIQDYQGVNKADQTSIIGKKSGSEGYGSHIETEFNDSIQSDGRARLGVPVMTSTPTKGQGVNKFFPQENTITEMNSPQKPNKSESSKTGFSVLNRPVDPVIGLKAIYRDYHRDKLSRIQPNKRIIGEIAFQLDRRILEYVFTWKQGPSNSQSKRRRFYGFSLSNIGKLIRREATDRNGQLDPRKELEMRYRFDRIMKSLYRFGYNLEKHPLLSQDLVNRYGLLSGPPEKKLAQELGLNDPVVLRLLLSQLIVDEKLLEETLILLDCLCLLAYEDQKTIFLY